MSLLMEKLANKNIQPLPSWLEDEDYYSPDDSDDIAQYIDDEYTANRVRGMERIRDDLGGGVYFRDKDGSLKFWDHEDSNRLHTVDRYEYLSDKEKDDYFDMGSNIILKKQLLDEKQGKMPDRTLGYGAGILTGAATGLIAQSLAQRKNLSSAKVNDIVAKAFVGGGLAGTLGFGIPTAIKAHKVKKTMNNNKPINDSNKLKQINKVNGYESKTIKEGLGDYKKNLEKYMFNNSKYVSQEAKDWFDKKACNVVDVAFEKMANGK